MGEEHGGVTLDPATMDAVAQKLQTLASDLSAGRVDMFLLSWADDPSSHEDVAEPMRQFVEFGQDQYLDVIALLVSLSTRVSGASATYQVGDQEIATDMTTFLTDSTYVPAEERRD
jgi:hypothetical protein